jgi:crossover junction endodeoxyribonuclease RusA
MSNFEIALPYPPSVNHIWRVGANSKVYKSKDGRAWADEAAWLVKSSGVKVVGPYILTVIVHRPDKRKRDLGNLDKAVSDALQAGGAVQDDCMCALAVWGWSDTTAEVNLTPHGLPVVCVTLGTSVVGRVV